jgi:hypothetical protein
MTGNNLGLCVVPVMDSIWTMSMKMGISTSEYNGMGCILSMKMGISTSEYNGMGCILWQFEIRVGFCTQLVH